MKGNNKTLALTTKNFRRICALNRKLPADVISASGRTKQAVYRAMRNPRQYKPTIQMLETLLPERIVNGR